MDVRGLAYVEILPDADLSEDVEYCWMMQATRPLAVPFVRPSLSKGCLDVVIPLAGSFCSRAEQHLFGAGPGEPYLVGPLSSAAWIATAGECLAFGARFLPGRARTFFPFPSHELTDKVLPVRDVSPSLAQRLTNLLLEQKTPARGLAALQRALAGIRRSRAKQDSAVSHAIGMIEDSRGCITVAAIADSLGIEVRLLQRRFRNYVGLSPKQVCRIARVRHAMELLARPGRRPAFADVAPSCGFYDQAHFIHEFRAIAGMTPSALARCAGYMTFELGRSDAFLQYVTTSVG